MVRISRRHLLGGATAVGFAGSALAQTKPIRILVGFAAGGGNDVIARLVAQKMGEGASGQVLVDNKTGASGLIAADILAKAPPDGTTLMVATQTTYAVAPQLYKSVAFDAPRDVAGISLLGASPLVLVVNPSFAAKSVGELIEMAKAKPGAINYGSGGVGTTPHTAAELFLFNSGVRMTHVAYRGEAPAIADVVAGQLPLLFANVSVVTGQVKAGTLRALAVTSPKRAPSLPDVPTLAEAGHQGLRRRDLVRPHRPCRDATRDRAAAECRSAEGPRRARPAAALRRAQPVGDAELARGARCVDQVGGGALGRGDPPRQHPRAGMTRHDYCVAWKQRE